jgi:DNA polymerase I-like protein with 3'-5' exonuclease and polymerase domains
LGLLKSLPPRATKQSDAQAVSKASRTQTVAPTVKGGKGIFSTIATVISVVNTKLGKYKDRYVLLREEQEVRDYFDAIIQAGIAGIDTETSSKDPMTCALAGVCLYTPGQKPAYIPLHHVSYITGVETSGQVDEAVVIECLKKCNAAGVKWIYHNAKFDMRVIWNKLHVYMTVFWDTYQAARCLNENELSNELKELHLKYCKSDDKEALTFDKLFEGIPFTHIPISTGYLYAAGDPLKTFELYEYQKQYLNRMRLPGPYNVFRNIEIPLIPVVADMEDTGVCLDLEFAKVLSEKYHKIMQEREANYVKVLEMYKPEIDAFRKLNPGVKLDEPINANSPKQLAALLYDILNLKSPDKDKPRGTGEEILTALKHPLSKAIMDVRETAKLLSTYIDKMPEILNPNDGRLHCNYNQYGADTGRFSSSDPNLQNIPSHNKEIRKMFSSSEGYVLISCDFSQQEPRTLAHCSGDPELIQRYAEGKDIYAWIASSIYNKPYDDCKEKFPDGTDNPEGKKRRDSVKCIILGIMYGRGVRSIAEQLGISTKEAQSIIDKFYKAFPKVKEWMDNIIKRAKETGYVETVWGRKRRLPDVQLPPYEFSYVGEQSPNFDPLAFDDQTATSDEVDEVTQRYYIKKLKDTWKAADRRAIIAEAYKQGIRIKDNGGYIAEAERQCINSIIQGSSADMSKLAMIAIFNDEQLRKWKYKMLIPVHDEIIGECPVEYAKQCAERVSMLMINAAKERISVPMKCDAEITKVWYGEEVEVA